MNWLDEIQKAIDYIEENILEDIDYRMVANCANYSSYHFQRIFGIICGVTLGEYIRKRRLTLASQELLNKETKVIDVALKYGYETPESFSRAFYKFHGIKPSQVKKWLCIKNFSTYKN